MESQSTPGRMLWKLYGVWLWKRGQRDLLGQPSVKTKSSLHFHNSRSCANNSNKGTKCNLCWTNRNFLKYFYCEFLPCLHSWEFSCPFFDCIDTYFLSSAHKMSPCLTPAAEIHLRNDSFFKQFAVRVSSELLSSINCSCTEKVNDNV